MSITNAGGLSDLPGAAVNAVIDPISSLVKGFEGLLFGKKARDLRGPDFPDGFQIIEVIDGIENTDTMIRLTGNMMPMIPFEWGGEQRLTKDYYPGNAEPAVQVMGPKESDVTIHGKFKDKHLEYDEASYGMAYRISDYLDKLRKRGNLCKFILGPWVRYGFIEKTDFKLEKLTGVEYSLQLFIVGLNAPTNCKLVAKSKEVPLDVNKEMIDNAIAFSENYSAIPDSMPKSIADVLNAAISDVATAINLVTNFVDTVVTTAEDVQKSVNRALGLIKNARTSICVFQRRVGNIQTGFTSLSSSASAATNFKSVFTNQSHLIRSISASSGLADILARLQKQFEAISKTVPMARYKVIDGDTLQKVSLKYYRTADHWDRIYDHNKLSTTVLTMGQMLEIPRL